MQFVLLVVGVGCNLTVRTQCARPTSPLLSHVCVHYVTITGVRHTPPLTTDCSESCRIAQSTDI